MILYRILILIPLSWFLNNIWYRLKYWKKWKNVKATAYHYRRIISNVIDIEILTKKYDYVPDPLFGFLNFEPSLEVFIARGGADCSGWSKIISEFLPNSKRWLLVDGCKIMSLHFVTTLKIGEGRCLMWNVSQEIEGTTEKHLIELFGEMELVTIANRPYRYKKLRYWEWKK